MSGRVFNDDRVADSIEGLIELCKDWIKPDMVMAEIGCFRGVSTSIFAQYARYVYAIDPWLSRTDYTEIPKDMMEQAEAEFDKVVEEYPNIIKIKGLSVEKAETFSDDMLDAVYIDGDHSQLQILYDLVAWIPKVKDDGLIMGHDAPLAAKFIPTRAFYYDDESWVYRK